MADKLSEQKKDMQQNTVGNESLRSSENKDNSRVRFITVSEENIHLFKVLTNQNNANVGLSDVNDGGKI